MTRGTIIVDPVEIKVDFELRLEIAKDAESLVNRIRLGERVFVPEAASTASVSTSVAKIPSTKRVKRAKATTPATRGGGQTDDSKVESAHCEWCNHLYRRSKSNQRFCKPECSKAWHNKHWAKKDPRPQAVKRGHKPGPKLKSTFGAAGADENVDAPRSRDSLLTIDKFKVPAESGRGRSGD